MQQKGEVEYSKELGLNARVSTEIVPNLHDLDEQQAAAHLLAWVLPAVQHLSDKAKIIKVTALFRVCPNNCCTAAPNKVP